MIELRPLSSLEPQDIARVTGDYTCNHTYRVSYADSEAGTRFSLELVPLAEPFVGRYDHFDNEDYPDRGVAVFMKRRLS